MYGRWVFLSLILFVLMISLGCIFPNDTSNADLSFHPGFPSQSHCASNYPTTVLSASPIGYWRLNDSTGTTAADASGSGNAGGYIGGFTLGLQGVFPDNLDTSVNFNGTSGYTSLPSGLIMNSTVITVEGWFQTTTEGVVISVSATGYPTVPANWVPVVYVGSDGLLRGEYWMTAVTPITSTSMVTDGHWHYFALTGNVNTQTFYLDGISLGTLPGTITPLTMSINLIGLGDTLSWPMGNNNWLFFNGNIDEVAIYYQALTPTEVQAHYNAAVQVTCQ